MDILSNIKKNVLEPKVYALMLKSASGQTLHIGVHFSLEEAFSVGVKRMEALVTHHPGEAVDIDLWNCIPARQLIAQMIEPSKVDEVFNVPQGEPSLIFPEEDTIFIKNLGDVPSILAAIVDSQSPKFSPAQREVKRETLPPVPTVSECVQDLKVSKNNLMKMLIKSGDIDEVEKVKDLLGSNSRKYVINKIVEEKNISRNLRLFKKDK